MRILFTICGRAGSKGFKNKNLKEMNGVPLVYYTLAAIKAYKDRHLEDDIIIALNTDSEGLKLLISQQNTLSNIRLQERKKELAGDNVAKIDVIRDTYFALKDEKGMDVIIDLDITSPLRRVEDIENVIAEYQSDKDYDLVVSVVEARRSPYFNMVEKKGRYYRKIISSNYTARQETPKSYELNASIYAYNPVFLESEITNTILDNRCGIAVMEDYRVLDIDSEEDFQMMEHLHRLYCNRDKGLREVFDVAKRIEETRRTVGN